MPELASFLATVHGRVQGVFFRSFVQKRSQSLGLTGYVKNLPGGRTLEVRAEGKKPRLDELLKHIHKGPPFAKIKLVDVEWSEYGGGFQGFQEKH